VAAYCEKRLNAIGIPAWRNPNAITIVFPKVHDSIISKWQLATQETISHIICMPNVTKEQIDHLILDIQNCEEVVENEYEFSF
jgi:histidine decarboxylase